MYIIRSSGEFHTCGGAETRRWAWCDDDGQVLLFDTKRQALEYIGDESSEYEGIPSYNVLTHNQICGHPAKPVWVRDGLSLPRYAQ